MCTWKPSVIEEGQERATSQPCATIFCAAGVHVKVGHVYWPSVEPVLKTLTRLTLSVKPDWEPKSFQFPCLKHVERHLVGVHNRTSLIRLLPPSALLWVSPLQEMIDAYGCGMMPIPVLTGRVCLGKRSGRPQYNCGLHHILMCPKILLWELGRENRGTQPGLRPGGRPSSSSAVLIYLQLKDGKQTRNSYTGCLSAVQ